MGVLVAVTRDLTSTPAAHRDARPARIPAIASGDAWATMSALERGLAADREDPGFDYAAN
jgi:hypothetical protein